MPLTVDIWSDIACPWCYVGKRRFEAGLERFRESARVELRWHSFELHPDAPPSYDATESYPERLARKYATSVAQGEAMVRTMTEAAATDGLDLRFDRIRPGNTFDAHRLMHLAQTDGHGEELREGLFRAYLTEGEAIGERDVLERLGARAGLAPELVAATLAGDAFAAEVRADEDQARRLGISAVPCFVLAGRFGLQGAQPAEAITQALERAWAELAPEERAGALPEGESCGPDGDC